MTLEKSQRKPSKAQRHAAIRALCGSLRRQPGGPSFAERTAAFKAEERALEQRREDCLMSIGRGKPFPVGKLQARLQRLRQESIDRG